MNKYSTEIYLIIHILAGIVISFFPLTYYIVVAIYIIALIKILSSTKSTYYAILFSAYLVGWELTGRMTYAGLPHEFTKYAISSILLLAFMLNRDRKWDTPIVIFFLLLIPAVFLTHGRTFEESRQLVSANLSGLLCLTISVLVFNGQRISTLFLTRVFLLILLPIVTMLTYLIVKTPDLSSLDFGYQSNFVSSIYGPNQVSSILGLGILIIGISYLVKIKLFQYNIIGLPILLLMSYRALATFSRGGVLTAFVILILGYLLVLFSATHSSKLLFRNISLIVLLVVGSYFVFDYANKITEGQLYNRYAGVKGERKLSNEEYTSGRALITAIDVQMFADNLLTGIGVGMGKFERSNYGFPVEVAAHIEFTRLLAEHGILGGIALLIMIIYPILIFYRQNNSIYTKVLIVMCIGFCFMFMSHSATRLAAPVFLYGLAFVQVIPFSFFRKSYTIREQAYSSVKMHVITH